MSVKLEVIEAKLLQKNQFGKVKLCNKGNLENIIAHINKLNQEYFLEYELYSYLLWLDYQGTLQDDNNE
jgi:hypothetical protein